MTSATELSDLDDDILLPNEENEANDSVAGGYASDEAIEDSNVPDDDNSNKKRVDPATSQKRIIKNPQPKLDAERLKGPKGIHTIEQHFQGFKFRGKGYEKSDLNKLMKKLEYWSHRLFPKYTFDDCLTKIEVLGTKKPVQTHLTRIRLELLTDDDVILNDPTQGAEEVVADAAPIDEFDVLIAEELEKQRQSTALRYQNSELPSGSSKISDNFPKTSTSSQSNATSAAGPSTHQIITTEMKERIERNRQIAIQKRLARIEAMKPTDKAQEQQSQVQEDLTGIAQENKVQTPPESTVNEMNEGI